MIFKLDNTNGLDELARLMDRNNAQTKSAIDELQSETEKRIALLCEAHNAYATKLLGQIADVLERAGQTLPLHGAELVTSANLDTTYLNEHGVAFLNVPEKPCGCPRCTAAREEIADMSKGVEGRPN
jgi:hypothetical protein